MRVEKQVPGKRENVRSHVTQEVAVGLVPGRPALGLPGAPWGEVLSWAPRKCTHTYDSRGAKDKGPCTTFLTF